MEEILGEMGYIVNTASCGEEAIGKYQSWSPDIVVMDRNMPKMDGLTCIRKIKKIDPGLKVILWSGYNEKGLNAIDEKSLEMISGYITKPINIAELSHLLAELLNNNISG